MVVDMRGGSEPVVPLAVSKLIDGYSPRAIHIDEDHVRVLVEVVDRLPPVIVELGTMRIIDGVHRVAAFRQAGRSHVPAVLFAGEETEALALAIEANVKHGKPLTRAERQGAAARLLSCSPERSDRWLAAVCGLSHTTVGKLRRDLDQPPVASRIGRDGRRRPVDAAVVRARTEKAVDEMPGASLRAVAESAGVAVSTAHRVVAGARHPLKVAGPVAPCESLRDDTAIRSRPDLDELSDWLVRTDVSIYHFQRYLERVPLGRVYELADECRKRARAWTEMGRMLEERARTRSTRDI